MITSDYHMTRSNLIFRRVLGSENHDNDANDGDKKSLGCKIICHASPNPYEKDRMPRPLQERPTILNEWFLSELIEIEMNATKNLNKDFMKYNISAIDANYIESAIEMIQKQYKKEMSWDEP